MISPEFLVDPKTAHASALVVQFLKVNEIVLYACETGDHRRERDYGCGAGETPEANRADRRFCQVGLMAYTRVS